MTDTPAPTTIIRWQWTLVTLEQMERYLSQMCAEGWRPVSISAGCRFVFERTEPGEYVCATAATVKRSGLAKGYFDSGKYKEMAAALEAQGATVVPQEATFGSGEGIVVVRRAADGPLELTSDIDSRLADLNARRHYHQDTAVMFFTLATVFFATSMMDLLEVWVFFPLVVTFFALSAIYGMPASTYASMVRKLERERPDR